ncbi:MAG: hypothetical protein WCB27_14965 [Thermoguttaceae bacterium]
MKDDLETARRVLEEATAADDRPAERLDAETASLREAWLAFGAMLEAAQPPAFVSPLPLGEEPGVRAAPSRIRSRRRRLLAAGLLAASLLVAAATIWTLRTANRQDNPADVPKQMAKTNQQGVPLPRVNAKGGSTADEPKWDDSLDEQFEQLGWQMLCIQENQAFRTDAFGQAQYRLEQLRETIQADSL